MPLQIHVAAPGSTNSEGLTTTPAREEFVGRRAWTEPDRTGIAAVYLGRGRQTRPKKILNHTRTNKLKKAPYTLVWPARNKSSRPSLWHAEFADLGGLPRCTSNRYTLLGGLPRCTSNLYTLHSLLSVTFKGFRIPGTR